MSFRPRSFCRNQHNQLCSIGLLVFMKSPWQGGGLRIRMR
jgi:hypothetical protein